MTITLRKFLDFNCVEYWRRWLAGVRLTFHSAYFGNFTYSAYISNSEHILRQNLWVCKSSIDYLLLEIAASHLRTLIGER